MVESRRGIPTSGGGGHEFHSSKQYRRRHVAGVAAPALLRSPHPDSRQLQRPHARNPPDVCAGDRSLAAANAREVCTRRQGTNVKKPDPYLIEAAVKVLDVLELFNSHETVRLTDVVEELGLIKSSAFRLLYTLEHK